MVVHNQRHYRAYTVKHKPNPRHTPLDTLTFPKQSIWGHMSFRDPYRVSILQRSNDAGPLVVCTLQLPSFPILAQYTLPRIEHRSALCSTTRRRPDPVGSVGCVSYTAGRLLDVNTSYAPSNVGCMPTVTGAFVVAASERRRELGGASSYLSLTAPLTEWALTKKRPPVPDCVPSDTDAATWLCARLSHGLGMRMWGLTRW